MFRTDLLSTIRSLNTVYTAVGICHASYVDCLLADSQHKSTPAELHLAGFIYYKIPIALYTVWRLLMMESRSVRNM